MIPLQIYSIFSFYAKKIILLLKFLLIIELYLIKYSMISESVNRHALCQAPVDTPNTALPQT